MFGLLVLTPLTFSAGGGVADNMACSKEEEPDCVREIDSVCTAGGQPLINHYRRASE